MALCIAKSIGANSVLLYTQQEVQRSGADIVQILVRPEGDNAALADNVNPDSPRGAGVADEPRHMQPCCLSSLAYIPLILASSLCCTKDRAERGSLLPKEVGGYLWSTRLRSFGIPKRPTARHCTLDTEHRTTSNIGDSLNATRSTASILES
jgi:hypothetical protein